MEADTVQKIHCSIFSFLPVLWGHLSYQDTSTSLLSGHNLRCPTSTHLHTYIPSLKGSAPSCPGHLADVWSSCGTWWRRNRTRCGPYRRGHAPRSDGVPWCCSLEGKGSSISMFHENRIKSFGCKPYWHREHGIVLPAFQKSSYSIILFNTHQHTLALVSWTLWTLYCR